MRGLKPGRRDICSAGLSSTLDIDKLALTAGEGLRGRGPEQSFRLENWIVGPLTSCECGGTELLVVRGAAAPGPLGLIDGLYCTSDPQPAELC